METFKDRLITLYREENMAKKDNRFAAFCIVIWCLDYHYSDSFIRQCSISQKADMRKECLETKCLPKNVRMTEDVVVCIFRYIIRLQVKFRFTLKNKILKYINDLPTRDLFCSLYVIYIKAKYERNLGLLYMMSDKALVEWIQKELKRLPESKKPVSYASSHIWGTEITHNIKYIPMGGQNKKY
jgi:hypothetical protein